MVPVATLFSLCCLSLVAASGSSSDGSKSRRHFLGTREGHRHLHGGPHAADLLAELEQLEKSAQGEKHKGIEARADRLESALRPIFRVAPKDSDARVDSNAARYILHRLFIQRHGWSVSGISMDAVRENSSVGQALSNDHRFSLRQLALFAATLETIIHGENMERLQHAFDVYGFARGRNTTERDAKRVVEAYMVMFVMSREDPGNIPDYWEAIDNIEEVYPTWPDTQLYAEEVRRAIFEDLPEHLTLWDSCLRVVEEIGERYGRWQNRECHTLKNIMLSMEKPGTGRVPLSSFWSSTLDGSGWMFVESAAYLDQLGALDGVAPHQSVLISNYVNSPANCVAASRYYDVCCINECEELLSELEEKIDGASAPPKRVAELVAAMASDTVQAPRDLPATLTKRLDDIAAKHGGRVPLHGRLFAQFMHHAYPRECPYPHESKLPPSPEERIKNTDLESAASESEMTGYIEAARQSSKNDEEEPIELPWTDDEELFMQDSWRPGAPSDLAAHEPLARAHHPEPSMLFPRIGLLLAMCALAWALRNKFVRVVCGSPSSAGTAPEKQTFV